MNSSADTGPAILVEGLTKLYRRTSAGHHLRTLKSALVERSLVRDLRPEESIRALDGLDFTVSRGEAIGLIGSNGSGKSTLLKILAGIYRPTEGTVTIDGRVAALIELGAGFHPEISGRENIFINGEILGLSRRQVEERYDEIVAFSGLADFIEEPVKNYSSGMYVRLGFSVAVHTDPEILLVDEVLAVGDEAFAHRCLRRIEEMLAEGRTLVLVSHSLPLIEDVCDRVLWLDRGRLRASGSPRRIVDLYREAVAEEEGKAHLEAKQSAEAQRHDAAADAGEDNGTERWGSRIAEIESVVLRSGGEERYHLHTGDDLEIELRVRAHRALEDFVFGVAVSTPRGIECWGTNTDLAGVRPERMDVGTATVRLTCPRFRLAPGEYVLDAAVHAHDGTPYDYWRRVLSFSVTSTDRGIGLYFPEHRWSFRGEGLRLHDHDPAVHEDGGSR